MKHIFTLMILLGAATSAFANTGQLPGLAALIKASMGDDNKRITEDNCETFKILVSMDVKQEMRTFQGSNDGDGHPMSPEGQAEMTAQITERLGQACDQARTAGKTHAEFGRQAGAGSF